MKYIPKGTPGHAIRSVYENGVWKHHHVDEFSHTTKAIHVKDFGTEYTLVSSTSFVSNRNSEDFLPTIAKHLSMSILSLRDECYVVWTSDETVDRIRQHWVLVIRKSDI